jgi:hypothetical protein
MMEAENGSVELAMAGILRKWGECDVTPCAPGGLPESVDTDH